jgi:hypothetical protein
MAEHLLYPFKSSLRFQVGADTKAEMPRAAMLEVMANPLLLQSSTCLNPVATVTVVVSRFPFHVFRQLATMASLLPHLFQFRNQVEVMVANHHRALPAMVVHSLKLFRFFPVVEVTVGADQANNKDQDHMEASSPPFQFRNQVTAANHHRGHPAMVVNQFHFLPAVVATVEADPASNNKDLQDMVASNLLFRQFQFRNQVEVMAVNHRRGLPATVAHSLLHQLRLLWVVAATVVVDLASNKDHQDTVDSRFLFQFRNQAEVMAVNHHRVLPAMAVHSLNLFRFLPVVEDTVGADQANN